MKILDTLIFRSPLLPFNSSTNKDIIEEALYLASPDFYKEYKKYHENKITDSKEIKKIEQSIYKYTSRAKTRCTPYGLFAGAASAQFGTQNNITLNGDFNKTLRRKTRLDMNVVCLLAQELGKLDFIRESLLFFPNNSIYKADEFYRYVEFYFINSKRIHKLSKVDYSEYLQKIFEFSETGKTLNDIAKLLQEQEITEEDSIAFIEELLSAQLLVSELQPTVTGPEFFEVLLDKLKKILQETKNENIQNILHQLQEIRNDIQQLDNSIVNEQQAYTSIFEKVKSVLPTIKETNLFQTDLFKNTETASVSESVKNNIIEAYIFLNKISNHQPNKNIEEFIKRFNEIYEGQELSLLEVLDTESGIGYPNKDVNGINDLIDDLGYYQAGQTDNKISFSKLDSILLKLLMNAEKENLKVIQLSDDQFKEIDFSNKSLPHTMSAMFEFLDVSNNTIYLHGTGGSSALNLLGRFGHGDKQILDLINEISAIENDLTANNVLAEIVHLPENRVGNILSRPTIREYEIPYLAQASVNPDAQLPLSDLFVSIRGNKIIVRSNKLNKQIIPRLGNAHNYSYNSLPVYHFLCDLQTQYYNKPYLSFSWGVMASQFVFLPRAEYKNCVLMPAKWQLKKNHFSVLTDTKNEEEQLRKFGEFKNKYQLPDLFLIADGDNELLIDVNNKTAILTFIENLKKRDSILLQEFLFNTEEALVKDSEGNSYTNECIAIVVNEDNKFNDIVFPEKTKNKSIRDFAPGSEWLYYKIYGGVKTADHVLSEKIKPLTEDLLEKKLIDKWFFIRYSDPENHLRFRLHISNRDAYSQVMLAVYETFHGMLENKSIHKIITDTYSREIERYGDNSITIAEEFFYFDSVCCANTLNLLDADTGNAIRWQYGIRAVDQFLEDFMYTLEEKYNLMNGLSVSFFKEHGEGKNLKLALDNKFRNLRKELDAMLNRETDAEKDTLPLIEFLDQRSEANKKPVQQILMLENEGKLQMDKNNLMASYIHMMLNRLFMGRPRTNEFVVYDLLARYYKSSMARTKKQTTIISA